MVTHDLHSMSLYALKQLRKQVSDVIRERERVWRKDRHRKYGNMNKGFTPEELTRFLAHVPTEKYRVLFLLQALAGLRVHEAVIFEWSWVDWHARTLYVHSEKTRRCDTVPMSQAVERLLVWWRGRCDGVYLFPGEALPHVSCAMAGKRFREAADRAGLTMTYCTDTRGYKRRRLSTHSLRHFFVTMVQRKSRNPELARRLARHINGSTTMLYIHPTEEEVFNAVEIF